MLPGVYRERRWATQPRSDYCSHLATESQDPLVASSYIGSVSEPGERPEADGQEAAAEEQSDPIALSYADQRRCPGNLNLISVFGDRTPRDDSIACNSRFCDLQIVGTGARKGDVLIDNDFQKLNAIRADRAGGVVIRNLTAQQAEFNAIYVLETDGFLLDKVVTRGNDEYGILAFASDHGVIQRTNNYYNGDSGIYPGSASDLNGDNESFEPSRYAIEIRRNRSHHNTLGYSGTAGNSVYAHHNRFYRNATGIATDSLFPGHPGLPQDHARWSRNEIYSNNTNYFAKYVDTGVCAKPMRERGYLQGAVCPVIPTPVGTGVLIAGGNFNSTDHNWIYDNWRYGTMQFWVPAPLRDEMDPAKLYDTSHHNHTVGNRMGITPDGRDPAQRPRPLVGRRGRGQLLGRQPLLPRRADRQLHRPAAELRGRRLGLHARHGRRQGRRLPLLQPVRPRRPDPAAPARVHVVRQPGPPRGGRRLAAPGARRRTPGRHRGPGGRSGRDGGRAAARARRGPPAEDSCVGGCSRCCCSWWRWSRAAGWRPRAARRP